MARTEIIEQIIRATETLPDSDWNLQRACDYLLGCDNLAACAALRRLVPRLLSIPYIAECGYWQKLDSWLERPPLERCLAHMEAFESVHALALLEVTPQTVAQVISALLSADAAHTKGGPLFGLQQLVAIRTLQEVDVATASEFLPRLTPRRWIEHMEYAALCRRQSGAGELENAGLPSSLRRPHWVRNLHPAIARDPLGGAWMKVILAEDEGLFPSPMGRVLPGQWVLYGDIDECRRVNDRLGHLGGDLAIWGVTQTLQEAVGDSVIRFAGNQFLILHDGDGPAFAERLRQRVEGAVYAPPIGHLESPVRVTISFGVARAAETAPSIMAAEEAVHEAKRNGRNRVIVAGSH